MRVVDMGPTEWSFAFTCEQCGTVAEAGPGDLEADSFKVSGYFFTDTAVCERKLYLVCPTCDKLYFLSDEEGEAVPYLVAQRGEAIRERRLNSLKTATTMSTERT